MKRKPQERGQALILIAFGAIALFGFTALAVDGTRVFSDRRHAQNAADVLAVVRGVGLEPGQRRRDLLAAARRLVQSAAGVAAGRWPREDGHELRGSTLGLIGTWQVFDQIYVMSQGNPAKTTLTPAYLSYRTAFRDLDYGSGAAISFVLDLPFLVIILAVMFFYSWQLSLIALGIVFLLTITSVLVGGLDWAYDLSGVAEHPIRLVGKRQRRHFDRVCRQIDGAFPRRRL